METFCASQSLPCPSRCYPPTHHRLGEHKGISLLKQQIPFSPRQRQKELPGSGGWRCLQPLRSLLFLLVSSEATQCLTPPVLSLRRVKYNPYPGSPSYAEVAGDSAWGSGKAGRVRAHGVGFKGWGKFTKCREEAPKQPMQRNRSRELSAYPLRGTGIWLVRE